MSREWTADCCGDAVEKNGKNGEGDFFRLTKKCRFDVRRLMKRGRRDEFITSVYQC